MSMIRASSTERPAELTPAAALRAARDLRPLLLEQQAETEARTYHSEEMHRRFLDAGFYHLLTPKTFGGYEHDLVSFYQVMRELARGDVSTAWCLCLASGHNILIASWFPERTQREIYAGEYMAAPMTVTPGGVLTQTDDGWRLDSQHAYCSGAPYSTHFVGHAFVDRPGNRMSTFIAPRESWTMLDDWGTTLGMRGSGSHSLRFEGAELPDHWVLLDRTQVAIPVEGGTPGLALHGNPMYGGRPLGFFATEIANLTVGAALGALDAYEQLMVTRKTRFAPIRLRSADPDYQVWFGEAVAVLAAAEAIIDACARRYMELCERSARGGEPFSEEEDVLITNMAGQAQTMAWKAIERSVFRTAGSQAATAGSRLERAWRDLSMTWNHGSQMLRETRARQFSLQHFADVDDGDALTNA